MRALTRALASVAAAVGIAATGSLATAGTAMAATSPAPRSAVAASPSSASAATTWQAMDKVCKTYTALDGVTSRGQICAEVQKRVTDTGSVTGYRGRVVLAPVNGYEMKPTTFHWSTGVGLSEVCAGGCAPQAGAWTSAWSPVHTAGSGPYKVQGEFGDGSLWDLHASWSAWQTADQTCLTYTAGKVCVRYEVRGYRDTLQERSRLNYTPVKGGYIIPISIGVGSVIDGSTTGKTRTLCQPCTKRTTSYSATVSRDTPNPAGTNEYYATARFEHPNGKTSTLKAAITG
ncbi:MULTISPECIES: hypothetical protein [unclassified Streptomyces]|uniref:hypothetical protein n=1 Tax=unclassified Streptomyces TaxID=2593676 RepID=UPI0011C9DDC2|nr:hypothetical protein [Streptomyces sp. wa22]TXS12656.1 hypothetical protein EAO68_22455 [Streptomyces sp. wa22]WSQ82659.1 hypothetical protein OG725_36470 [Streptomyces sp. NBC_01213]